MMLADETDRATGAMDAIAATEAVPPRRISLLGMPMSVVTETEAIAFIIESLAAGSGGWVITPNLDQLRLFRKSRLLRPMYNRASLVLADGMPLVWASRLQKTPLPQRVPGSSLILTLTAAAAKAGRSVFFLGGNPGAADRAAAELANAHPELKVAGTYCPPFGFDKDATEIDRMRELLASANPDIIYV